MNKIIFQIIFALIFFSSCFKSQEVKEVINELKISNHYYINISIDSLGNVFLNQKEVITDTLDIALSKLYIKSENLEKEVIINLKVDENTSMKIVTDVKLKLRKADLMQKSTTIQ